jgi:hypothetical protein
MMCGSGYFAGVDVEGDFHVRKKLRRISGCGPLS